MVGQGRSDDIITSAGYRIGPVEIEECLLKHPAVALAAVIGVPDPIRTEVVKACRLEARRDRFRGIGDGNRRLCEDPARRS